MIMPPRILTVVALVAAVLPGDLAFSQEAEELPLTLSNETVVGGFVEPARRIRAEGWDWDHEVRIYLPPSYRSSDRTYPTLWVTDNSLELIQGALMGAEFGMAPELIVVAVGAPTGTSPAEFQRRRSYDFIPDKSLMGDLFAAAPDGTFGGAPGFLHFLVHQLRPLLAEEYRMDPEDHGYAGHSGGAQFGLYVLFNEPESFDKYVLSSPAVSQPWLEMEEAWNEEHKDLEAKVFLSAGEAEASDPVWAAAQIVSTVALVAERLATRNYESLELSVRIFPGEDHLTVMPIAYMRGVRQLYAE